VTKRIEIKVKSVKGFCSAGYKEGDILSYCEPNITSIDDKPICIYALSGLIPYLTAFGRKTDENDWINELRELQCPDSTNTVVFSLQRS
jgi:uncharacterized repeat protein (TIGR04076 family)